MPARASGPNYSIRSVERVCDILDLLANAPDGVGLAEIAAATAMPKSSTFRYLTVLEARHYVGRGADGSSYTLGPAFPPQHNPGVPRLVELARPGLEQLRDRFGETTNLGVLDGTEVTHALVCDSRNMMRLAARVGDRGPVHSTALGKVMCTLLPTDRVRHIVESAGTPAYTAQTITGVEQFLAEVERVRDLGYGVDDGENQDDGRCVAVALPGLDFPAGISVSAPASRLPTSDVPTVAKALRRQASALVKRMRS